MKKKLGFDELLRNRFVLFFSGIVLLVSAVAAFIAIYEIDAILAVIISILLFFVGILFSAVALQSQSTRNTMRKIYKTLNLTDAVADDYNGRNTVFLDKRNRTAIGEKYFFALDNGIIYPYSEIFWVYMTEKKKNGFPAALMLTIRTSDGKVYNVAAEKANDSGEAKLLKYIMLITARNPECLAGFTNENMKIYKQKISVR